MQHSCCHRTFQLLPPLSCSPGHRLSVAHRTIKSSLTVSRGFPASNQDVFVYLQILCDLKACAWPPSYPLTFSFVLTPCWCGWLCLFLTHTCSICVLGTSHTHFLRLHTFLSRIRRLFSSLPAFRLCQSTFSAKPCSHYPHNALLHLSLPLFLSLSCTCHHETQHF